MLDDTDLSFCECNLCQEYKLRDYGIGQEHGLMPPLEANEIATTHLTPGIEANQSLCLYHWTFFHINTAAPEGVQSWKDPDVAEHSTISAALGAQAETPQQLILTFDTEYEAEQDRFTTVDAFLHTSPELPENWYEVHKGTVDNGNNRDYPALVFHDLDSEGNRVPSEHYVDFYQRDSFTYTLGYDDADGTGGKCSAKLPTDLYLAVRCGNPLASAQSWEQKALPCKIRVRYVLVPQFLVANDVLGPLPAAPLATHAYSVLVGGCLHGHHVGFCIDDPGP